MKIILFLLANSFLVNTTLLQNNIDSVDKPDHETEYDSVDIDDETVDDNDDGMLEPYQPYSNNVPEIKKSELINNTKIDIKLNNLTINQKFSEIMNNGLNEIRQKIKGIEKE